jgi:hypothetical protein
MVQATSLANGNDIPFQGLAIEQKFPDARGNMSRIVNLYPEGGASEFPGNGIALP